MVMLLMLIILGDLGLLASLRAWEMKALLVMQNKEQRANGMVEILQMTGRTGKEARATR